MLKAMGLLKRKPSDGAPKAPFKQRLLAWWEGVDLPPMEAPPPRPVVERAPEPPPPPIKRAASFPKTPATSSFA